MMRRLVGRLRGGVPLHGYCKSDVPTPLLDSLSDNDLERLNRLLPWQAFVTDGAGRRFGDSAWKGKRDVPQAVPDRRIRAMDSRFCLAGKCVLELGCFEGVHTVGLAHFAGRVKAVDSRIENVAKTVVRCSLFGVYPEVSVWDVEQPLPRGFSIDADYAHHVGVLYHLHDPVTHLMRLGPHIRDGIMLDTHYSEPSDATNTYVAGGAEYAFREYREFGRDEVFSGMSSTSKWLTLDGLMTALRNAGFHNVEVSEKRAERNGPRALLFASK